jgi:hypothetical protein
MATKLDIFNMALSFINEENIADIDEDSIPAKKALLYYPEVLRRLIERYEWSFCSLPMEQKGEEVQRSNDKNIILYPNGYRYRYRLINGAVKFGSVIRTADGEILNSRRPYISPIRVNSSLNMRPPYITQGTDIYADVSPLMLKFIMLEEDTSYYSSNFTWALAYGLAEALTKVLIDSASYQQAMTAQAERYTLDAIAEDQRKFPTEFMNY